MTDKNILILSLQNRIAKLSEKSSICSNAAIIAKMKRRLKKLSEESVANK